MPPRLELLKNCWSSVELPILPFLAPRVFEPWPPSSQGRLRSAARNLRCQSALANLSHDEHSGCGREGSKSLKLEGKDDVVLTFENLGSRAKRGNYNPFEARKISKPRTQKNLAELQPSTTIILKDGHVEQHTESTNSLQGQDDKKLGYNDGILDDAGAEKIYNPMKESLQPTLNVVASPQTRKPLTWRQIMDAPEHFTWRSIMNAVEKEHPGMTRRYDQPTGSHHLRSSDLAVAPNLHDLEYSGPIKDFWRKLCDDAGERIHGRKLAKVWNPLIGLALLHDPKNALDFLEAMHVDGLGERKVSDIIHCVVYASLRGSDSGLLVTDLMRRIVDLYPKYPGLHLSPTTVYRLLCRLPISALREFYKSLTKNQIWITNASLFQFASRFAKDGDTDLAFEILRRLRELEADFNTPTVLSLCTSIIRHAQDDPRTQHQTADIFKFVHESGMIPNVITYNVLILSTIGSGDSETAWKIHDMMVEIGIETDKFTYSILLHDAKLRRDTAAAEVVRNLVRQRGIISDYIATDELHLIYLLAVDEDGRYAVHKNVSSPAFDRMFKYYSEYFDIEPLRRLIPYLPTSNVEVVGERMAPGPAVLNVMIAGFLRECHSYHLRQFYQNIRHLVLNGDEAVKDLLKTTYLYNTILLSFGRHEDLWGEAPGIVADMVSGDDHPKTDNALSGTGGTIVPQKPHALPKPNTYTWNILLGIFMQQRLPQAAERVLTMMTRRKVTPTTVTWNQLVKGYAFIQDEKMVVDTLSRLGDSGLRPDEATFHHLYTIRDKARFENELLKRNLIVKSDFMEQLQRDVVVDVLKNRRRRY